MPCPRLTPGRPGSAGGRRGPDSGFRSVVRTRGRLPRHWPGARTIVHVSARLAASVVAVSPPYVPLGTVPPLSATRDVTRPAPVPIDVPRVVTPPGAVQAPVTEDLSDQY